MRSWQADADDVAGTTWPVAIVGCGPAGATAALHLARRGVRVVALEKQRFPRDKVCGDALIPDALRALARAGLLEEVASRSFAAERLVLCSPSGIELPIRSKALVIRRMELDALLAEGAARAGATVATAMVRSIAADGDRVRLELDGGRELSARIAILATGADVRLLRQIATIGDARASAVAVRRYVASAAVVEDLILSFDRSIVPGYAWIFPLPDGYYNVGCGITYDGHARVDLAKKLDTFFAKFVPAKKILDRASEVGPLRGAVLRTGLTTPVKGLPRNVLAIGESIGATFPLSGEGIGKAMEMGERAAEIVARALLSNDPRVLREFERYVRTLRPLYDAYRLAEGWMARPWLNDAVVRLARRSAYAQRAFAEILEETAGPQAIFSLRGVLRMLI